MTTRWNRRADGLDAFTPLLGSWVAEATTSPMGAVKCTRVFEFVLNNKFVQLNARWEIGAGEHVSIYEEIALYGVIAGQIKFWSFTSDGKRSEGELADAVDLHPDALAFEAAMPAGRARMVYWPLNDGGVKWVAEAMTTEGWSRMVDHDYHAV